MDKNKTIKKQKKRKTRVYHIWFLILPATLFALLLSFLMQGKNVALFNPQGFIAQEQHNLMVSVTAILFAVAIPSLLLLYFIAWKYRDTNTKVVHHPPVKRSKYLVLVMWLIPIGVMVIIATIMWPATHRLAPQKSIESDVKPMTIQVISLRWKWVFLYPEQQIATVNFVQIPVNTPVQFEMTADETPMSSFWIPNLGGQLYTMTSHVNRLNLMAETVGDYPGSTTEINGSGFSGMKFVTRASSEIDFDQWVNNVKTSPETLSMAEYEKLVVPSENNSFVFYSSYENSIYGNVLMKYNDFSGGHMRDDDHEKESSEGHGHN